VPVPVEAESGGLDVVGGFLVVPPAPAVVAPATPFLRVPTIVVRFAVPPGGLLDAEDTAPAREVAIAVAGRFLTTVPVLASLDSLAPLALRAVRVPALEGGFGADVVVAARRVRVAVDVVEPVVAFRMVPVPVPVTGPPVVRGPVARALSTAILEDEPAFTGDGMGRAIPDFLWGLVLIVCARSRGAIRELDEAGERTWLGWRAMSWPGAPGRVFFCWWSFSLSPPEMSRLNDLLATSFCSCYPTHPPLE